MFDHACCMFTQSLCNVFAEVMRCAASYSHENHCEISTPWQAFRPGATDLPAGATEVASGAINDEQRFGNFYDDRIDGDLMITAFDRYQS